MFYLAFNTLLDGIHSEYVVNLTTGLAVILTLRMAYLMIHKRPETTRLRGPSSGFLGADRMLLESYSGDVYQAWYKEYGAVYEIPMILGERKIVLGDSKAIAHFFDKNSWTYTHARAGKIILEKSVGESLTVMYAFSYTVQMGKGVVWADGEIHRMSVSLYLNTNVKIDLCSGSADFWHRRLTHLLFESYLRSSTIVPTR